MEGRVNDDPCDKEAREISHEAFFNYLVYSTVGLVVNSESGTIGIDINAGTSSKS